MPLAYSYVRFSSPEQARGDSLRRQQASRTKWLTEHPGIELDTTLEMTDAGRSAFRRKDPDTYALARFLEHVKAGRVEQGSYLLVENLDRLSREDAGTATELLLGLVNRGIVVVQLMPVVMEFRKPVNVQSLMFAIVELSRGNSESMAKSERVGAAWERKRQEASQRVVTRRVPGWVKYADGKLVLDHEKAETIRTIFRLAHEGKGVGAIARLLNERGTPVIGRKTITPKGREQREVKWNETVVYYILISRATIGEYQPCKGYGSAREPSGDPIPNYYPPVIDETLWHAVQAGMKSRAHRVGGRRGKHVNLFAGMLVDARDGDTITYKHVKNRNPTLIPVGAKQGRGTAWSSYPVAPFEEAILSKLREVTVADLGQQHDATVKVEQLAGQLAEVDSLLKVWTAKMDDASIVEIVAKKLGDLNAKRKRLAAALADAQRDASSPIGEAWGEFRSLADLLRKDNSDEIREKVRAALRRSIESITCLFAGDMLNRIAAVRVQFISGQHRSYLIAYMKGQPHKPGRTSVYSMLQAGIDSNIDLRDRKAAKALESGLKRVDLTKLDTQAKR